MSSITLSAATRQNLLSLQDTASLMATTQNRLATGKTVNSALDNPTNFFTAQSLDSRSSGLNSLLDGVSNGVQAIQAANQGITSIQKLVDQAKSIANQALSTQLATTGTATNAYSTASSGSAVSFSVNGTTVTASASSSITATVAALNAAVAAQSTSSNGSFGAGAIFSVDSTGTKIVLNAQADVEFQTTASMTALGFATASATALSSYNGVNTFASSDIAISGVSQRKSLAQQYNNLLNQITQLAGDASYNGVNLIAGTGNDLKIKFNDTGSSNLDVASVDATASGLGLSAITSSNTPNSTSGAGLGNFLLNSDVNATLATLTSAGSTLNSAASALGSNLSVVQNRQDFSKQLINVLQTGSANLTNADLNQEAANSQALSTRQSMGISALSLANSAQQGVLQLLR